MSVRRTIHIEMAAPSKPPVGEACNGCGVCCLAEPCPLGMVWSWRRKGACSALVWDGVAGHYRCGLLVRAQAYWLLREVLRRWIGAGRGCDCQWEQVDAMASSTVLNCPEERAHGPQ